MVLVLVVVTALAFDFTNGFHDTGNAMATSIATGALRPKVAVAISGLLNLVGAFLSFTVAATIASGLVETERRHPDCGRSPDSAAASCGTSQPGSSASRRARRRP